MSDDGAEWWDDLEPEQVDRVHALVAQAEGCLRAALEELDGDGGPVRDGLAEAYGTVGYHETGLAGARKLTRGEDERQTVATYTLPEDAFEDDDGGEDA